MVEQKLTWLVKEVKTDGLQTILNQLEDDGYDILEYKNVIEQYDGVYWVVIAKLKKKTVAKKPKLANIVPSE